MKKILLALIAISVAYSTEILDRISVVIGEEIILQSEIEQYTQTLAIEQQVDYRTNRQAWFDLQQQTIRGLIDQKVILAAAKEESLTVDNRQLMQALDQHMQGLIARVGSEDALAEIFNKPFKSVRNDFKRIIHERLLVDQMRNEKLKNVNVSRREVEQYFEEYQDSLPYLGESVELGHILIKVQEGPAADSLARERVLALKTEIEKGTAKFEDLAEQYSEDPGSRLNGGELGFVEKGTLVKEFERVAFTLDTGKLSDPVRTEFGWHLIQVLERKGESVRIRHILIKPRAAMDDEQLARNRADSIYQAWKNGESFESLAKQFSDDDQSKSGGGHLGWFEVEKLRIEEFKTVCDTLPKGKCSVPVKSKFGFHLIFVFDRRPAGAYSLEQDWEKIERLALARKRNNYLTNWLDELKETLTIEIKL